MSDRHRILSRPVRLYWAGWETDTLRLQTAGWDLSAEQDVERNGMRVAFRHRRHDVRGITEAVDFPYWGSATDQVTWRPPMLHVEHIANRLWIRHVGIDRVSFASIDAKPQLQADWTMTSLDDLAHFAPAQASQQLILPQEEGVPELLARIVDMQSGARLERFRREIQEQRAIERVERPHLVHAQIITFPRAA